MADTTQPRSLPPPPRSVRRAPGTGAGCGTQLFLTPFVVIGLAVLIVVPLRVWVQIAGRPITATVDRLTTGHGSKGGTTYRVVFHYDLDGAVHTDDQQVTAAEYKRARRGQVVGGRVRVFFGHPLALTDIGNPWWQTVQLGGFALFWNGVMGWFGYVVVVQPRRTAALVRDGVAVPGVVVSHRQVRGRQVTRYVTYRFTTRDHRERSREMSIVGSTAAIDGMPITVMYDENGPARNVAYEFCGFVVEP